jgi:hypothetical protein
MLVETVDVSRVQQRDAGIERGAKDRQGLRLGGSVLNGEMHPTVADRGDRRGVRTQRAEVHPPPSPIEAGLTRVPTVW